MKKGSKAVVVIIVVIVLAVAAYGIFHKPKSTPNSSSSSTTTSSSSAPIVNNSVLRTKSSPSLGVYLAEPSGQALYTYGADSSGVSNCTGTCLASWPAYQDKGSTANLPTGVSTLKRADNGEIQFTYKGMPLYTFVGDSSGQVTGNGVSNFTIAKPVAASSSTTLSQPSSSTSTNSGSNW